MSFDDQEKRNDDWVAHYEQLRNDALSRPAGHVPAPGLALFLRKGMAAWMHAWSCCMPKPAPETASLPDAAPTCSVDLRTQIAVILAGMILGRQPEASP